MVTDIHFYRPPGDWSGNFTFYHYIGNHGLARVLIKLINTHSGRGAMAKIWVYNKVYKAHKEMASFS